MTKLHQLETSMNKLSRVLHVTSSNVEQVSMEYGGLNVFSLTPTKIHFASSHSLPIWQYCQSQKWCLLEKLKKASKGKEMQEREFFHDFGQDVGERKYVKHMVVLPDLRKRGRGFSCQLILLKVVPRKSDCAITSGKKIYI